MLLFLFCPPFYCFSIECLQSRRCKRPRKSSATPKRISRRSASRNRVSALLRQRCALRACTFEPFLIPTKRTHRLAWCAALQKATGGERAQAAGVPCAPCAIHRHEGSLARVACRGCTISPLVGFGAVSLIVLLFLLLCCHQRARGTARYELLEERKRQYHINLIEDLKVQEPNWIKSEDLLECAPPACPPIFAACSERHNRHCLSREYAKHGAEMRIRCC
eukprot:SAG11_NODE_6715_length_1261_cov_1.056799_1_plen_221_part_00